MLPRRSDARAGPCGTDRRATPAPPKRLRDASRSQGCHPMRCAGVLLLPMAAFLLGCTRVGSPSGVPAPPAVLESAAPASATPSPSVSASPSPPAPASSPAPAPASASVPPSVSPSASVGPAPASAPVGAPVVLAPGDFARVITDNLRRRSTPSVSQTAEIRGELLQPGAHLWVLAGPVRGSGYWWYQVALADPTGVESSPDRGIGWVASADLDGTPWLAHEAFADAVPKGSLVWSSDGTQDLVEATFPLSAGERHIIFSGVEGCVYRVQFGIGLEYDMGFIGAQLSTVRWPSGPEPSMATWGQGTGVTAMPSLPAGTYRLAVSHHVAMLAMPEPDYQCPWGLAITP